MKKLNCFSFSVSSVSSKLQVPKLQISTSSKFQMKNSQLGIVAGSDALLRNHILAVQGEFDACVAKASDDMRRKYVSSITALLKDVRDHRRMVIRMVQVQNAQINKYRKSIRDGRKTVKRGAPASVEAFTMETMIQMTMRVIQDLKDLIPELTRPLVQRIHANLRKLQDRMLLFSKAVNTSTEPVDSSCQCHCNSFGISCYACHQGAHEQCKCNCSI
jgi:hypothetical protein